MQFCLPALSALASSTLCCAPTLTVLNRYQPVIARSFLRTCALYADALESLLKKLELNTQEQSTQETLRLCEFLKADSVLLKEMYDEAKAIKEASVWWGVLA